MISFVGAGRVSKAVGRYFFEKGIEIGGYYSLNIEDSQYAAEITESRVFETIEELLNHSDMIFIGVNDDNIVPISKEIGDLGVTGEKIVGHFSGALESTMIKENLPENYRVFSLHPLQSFPGKKEDAEKLKDTIFTAEGEEPALKRIKSIFHVTGNKYVKIDSKNKSIYHAGSVVFSNYITTVLSKGFELFQAAGIEFEDASKMVQPLVEGTIHNALKIKPESSLTGPISRGDYLTVEKHIDVISENSPDTQEFYESLGMETLKLAQKKLLKNESNISEIKRILKEGK